MMLNNTDDTDFSILEIKPSVINLRPNELLRDNVEEATNSLHNYINRNNIIITPENVIGTFQANPRGISDTQTYEREIEEFIISIQSEMLQ